jgi:UDP-glucuronate 4-epimerase
LKILITGSAGFIGFHLSELLLRSGWEVIGVDNVSDYYDVNLKEHRLNILKNYERFQFHRLDISTDEFLNSSISHDIEFIVHLAAQAGVRYSIDDPKSYTVSNLLGTQNILELARRQRVKHLLMSSTSSVYGANTQMPFDEIQKTDHPLSYYAATKKSNEIMAHSYSYVFKIPITMFRFFTVYGPWGRPDMALFKFTKNIIEGKKIDVYNHGEMARDFTYVEDLVNAISKLISCIPEEGSNSSKIDSLSKVAPHRIVNIGNSKSVKLMDYISCLEEAIGTKANINFMPMQVGDVEKTEANTELLLSLTGYRPHTEIEVGVRKFVEWYRSYYG